MIHLFQRYNKNTARLLNTLELSGISTTTVVLEDDGWLPSGVTSVYKFFTGYIEGEGIPFNQLPLGDGLEVVHNGDFAKVMDYNHRVSDIIYAQGSHPRRVHHVLSEFDSFKVVDTYCSQGFLFSTVRVNEGKLASTSYYNSSGCEIITVDWKTRSVTLNENGRVQVFSSLLSFFLYGLSQMGINGQEAIAIDSLDLPYDILSSFEGFKKNENIIYLDEVPSDDLVKTKLKKFIKSGNFIINLQYDNTLKLKQLLGSRVPQTLIGHVEEFLREPVEDVSVLIETLSDDIVNLELLLQAHPSVQFHITAPTNMSSKLHSLESYDNLHLYPRVSDEKREDLYSTCAVYLDINRGREVKGALQRAFQHQMFIMAYDETAHDSAYVPAKSIFGQSDAGLSKTLHALENGVSVGDMVEAQHLLLGLANRDDVANRVSSFYRG